ncbi:MAG: Brp/Blh family beta-carotene 15,15'-dioxygenase [Pseudomonadota bacterium]|nr:Brp/Blh family beta-carotene 15,15'-dioxygenase [Pseudomonadota bacterium]
MHEPTIEHKLIPCWFILAIGLLISNIQSELYFIDLFFLLTIGIFHGAYDFHYAIFSKKLDTMGQIKFILQYVIIALAFIFFWLIYPNLGLGIFFIIASIHFGLDWDHFENIFITSILGYATLSISLYMHPDVTNQMLTHDFLNISPHTLLLLTSLTPVSCMLGLFFCIFHRRKVMLIQWLSFQLLGAILPPLTFFTIYFCGFHSIKHIQNMREKLNKVSGLDKMAVLLWLISIVVLVSIHACFKSQLNQYPLHTYFILLAGLTMPHMWLHMLPLSKN